MTNHTTASTEAFFLIIKKQSMELDDLHQLTEEQINRLYHLELKAQWEVVRDRCLIGYYQKLTGAELMQVHKRTGTNVITLSSTGSRTVNRIVNMHHITRQVFNKWRNTIPIIEPDIFLGYFNDILQMAGIINNQ
jgi:phosphoserine phosphatase